MNRRRGFTLIEVLLAMGLAAVISAAVLVPMVYTLNAIENARKEFGMSEDIYASASQIFRDIRSSSCEFSFPVIKTEFSEKLAVKNDGRLILWTASPANEGKPAGAVAYRIMSDGSEKNSGLYRWTLPPKASEEASSDNNRDAAGPAERDIETLKQEEGRLLLRGAEGIIFEAHDGTEWKREYSGGPPKVFRVSITMKDRIHVYEETLPLR